MTISLWQVHHKSCMFTNFSCGATYSWAWRASSSACSCAFCFTSCSVAFVVIRTIDVLSAAWKPGQFAVTLFLLLFPLIIDWLPRTALSGGSLQSTALRSRSGARYATTTLIIGTWPRRTCSARTALAATCQPHQVQGGATDVHGSQSSEPFVYQRNVSTSQQHSHSSATTFFRQQQLHCTKNKN